MSTIFFALKSVDESLQGMILSIAIQERFASISPLALLSAKNLHFQFSTDIYLES